MKIVTFLRKNGEPAKQIVDFPLERETVRNKIMEIVEDFDAESFNNNNNGKPWKSSRILSVNPYVFHFSFFFIIFLHFSFFFHVFIFSFFSFFHVFFFSIFHFSSFSFIFFHFLSCSFMFFHCSFIVLSCSLCLLGAQNLIFLDLNFVTISLDNSNVKNQILGPSRVYVPPSGPLFLFSIVFFVFFLLFLFFIFCSFLHFFDF